jgi:hypothetical protein
MRLSLLLVCLALCHCASAVEVIPGPPVVSSDTVPQIQWSLPLNTTEGSTNPVNKPTFASDGSGMFLVMDHVLKMVSPLTGFTVSIPLGVAADATCYQPTVLTAGINTRVYVTCYPNVLIAFDAVGNVLFNRTLVAEPQQSSQLLLGPVVLGTPPGFTAPVLVGAGRGSVFVFDSVTGLPLTKQIDDATFAALGVSWRVMRAMASFRTPASGVLMVALEGAADDQGLVPGCILRVNVPTTLTGNWTVVDKTNVTPYPKNMYIHIYPISVFPLSGHAYFYVDTLEDTYFTTTVYRFVTHGIREVWSGNLIELPLLTLHLALWMSLCIPDLTRTLLTLLSSTGVEICSWPSLPHNLPRKVTMAHTSFQRVRMSVALELTGPTMAP